jgi:type IV secretion system protein VirB2
MANKLYNPTTMNTKNMLAMMIMGLVLVATVAMPDLAFAQDFAGTDTKVCGFFKNINGLLNMASIAVVTIAVIFSGYQIAFAHKRIGDVAPILIGGCLIGAAAQIAKMLIGDTGQQCTAMVINVLNHYA